MKKAIVATAVLSLLMCGTAQAQSVTLHSDSTGSTLTVDNPNGSADETKCMSTDTDVWCGTYHYTRKERRKQLDEQHHDAWLALVDNNTLNDFLEHAHLSHCNQTTIAPDGTLTSVCSDSQMDEYNGVMECINAYAADFWNESKHPGKSEYKAVVSPQCAKSAQEYQQVMGIPYTQTIREHLIN